MIAANISTGRATAPFSVAPIGIYVSSVRLQVNSDYHYQDLVRDLRPKRYLIGIPTVIVLPRSSSRDIARVVLGDSADLYKFAGYHVHYTDKTSYSAAASRRDDGMDIDDDNSSANILLPSHALDLLHIQVVEHFGMLLVDLVARLQLDIDSPSNSKLDGTALSRYAPLWATKHPSEYSVGDCLDYLQTKRPLKPSQPRLEVFLSKPYASRGARRGQDWSRKDWSTALAALAGVGDVWQEDSIRESLNGLQPHLNAVFSQPMRPTGVGQL